MICPYCGKTTKDDARFCAACGHKIARCPSCNRVLRTNARFCGFDGTALPPELLLDLPAPMAAPVPPVAQPMPPSHSPNEVRPTEQTKERSKLPIILLAVLIVLLLAGAVVGVGLWQGWFSSDRSSDEEGTPSVSAGEAADQSEASEDGVLTADESEPQPEDTVQSETISEAEENAAQTSEGAAEADAEAEEQSDAEVEQAEVPISERTYEIVASDLSWSEANEAAREAGGHLATITSEEEYDVICALADESGLKYLWLGAALTSDEMAWGEDGCWITGEAWSFDVWYPGEPSLADADGTQEFCLCLWNAAYDGVDIGWTMNDQRDRLVEDFPSVSGKVGYIIEFDDGGVE